MALIVKAYFSEGNDPEVIKRFSVDADVTTSYEYLRTKIIQAFPNLSGRNFSTYWHDKEGDQIIFSSDDELIHALSQVDDGILKIYIKVFPRTSSSQAQFNQFIHGFPVFSGGLNFMKPPMSGTQPEFPFMTPAHTEVHLGVTCDGCEGAVVGVRFKCMKCPNYDLCETCKQKGCHAEHTFSEIPHPVNGFQEMLKQFSAQLAANVESGKETNSMQQDESQKSNLGNPNIDFQDHLKNVGKCVEAMLKPLGINLSIDVDIPPMTQQEDHVINEETCCKMKSAEKESSDKMACNKNSCYKKSGCDISNQIPFKKMASCYMSNDKEKLSNNSNYENNVEMVNSEKGVQNTSNKSFCQSPHKLQQQKSATVTVESLGAAALKSPVSNEWEEVEEMIFSKEEDNLNNIDKKIRDSISKMKGMGFNDEGGWLTALITATKGDMNKALDLIHAKP